MKLPGRKCFRIKEQNDEIIGNIFAPTRPFSKILLLKYKIEGNEISRPREHWHASIRQSMDDGQKILSRFKFNPEFSVIMKNELKRIFRVRCNPRRKSCRAINIVGTVRNRRLDRRPLTAR